MGHFFDYDSHGWLDPELCKDLTEEEATKLFIIQLVGFFTLIGIIGIIALVAHLIK